MAQVLDARGFQLNPNVLGRMQLGRKLGQQQLQQQQQAQINQLLGQAVSPGAALAPQVAPIQPGTQVLDPTAVGGVEPQAPPPVPTQAELIQQARQIDPIMAEQRLKALGLDSAGQRAEASRFAAEVQSLPLEAQNQRIQQRVVELRSQGRDPSDTEQLLTMPADQRQQALTGVQLLDLSTKERFVAQATAQRQRLATQKAFAPITIVNAAGEKRLVSPTVDNLTGKGTLAPFDIPEGFSISKETDEEKRAADVISKEQEAAAKITGKGQAERRQLQIDKGLDAAEGMANIQRALDLLNVVETGGVDAASLRAKQFFGVEGANEAELSNRMGKAVLSQLRATFGAAFTAKEGESLQRIEAGFGKSTAGNRRLLEQAKRLIQRAARRGIRAARRQGDLDTAQDIQDALEFRLGIEQRDDGQAAQAKAAPPPPGSAKVGRFNVRVKQ